jgi:hypothetical protein
MVSDEIVAGGHMPGPPARTPSSGLEPLHLCRTTRDVDRRSSSWSPWHAADAEIQNASDGSKVLIGQIRILLEHTTWSLTALEVMFKSYIPHNSITLIK